MRGTASPPCTTERNSGTTSTEFVRERVKSPFRASRSRPHVGRRADQQGLLFRGSRSPRAVHAPRALACGVPEATDKAVIVRTRTSRPRVSSRFHDRPWCRASAGPSPQPTSSSSCLTRSVPGPWSTCAPPDEPNQHLGFLALAWLALVGWTASVNGLMLPAVLDRRGRARRYAGLRVFGRHAAGWVAGAGPATR